MPASSRRLPVARSMRKHLLSVGAWVRRTSVGGKIEKARRGARLVCACVVSRRSRRRWLFSFCRESGLRLGSRISPGRQHHALRAARRCAATCPLWFVSLPCLTVYIVASLSGSGVTLAAEQDAVGRVDLAVRVRRTRRASLRNRERKQPSRERRLCCGLRRNGLRGNTTSPSVSC
jgi:hypothetical protein